MKEISASIAAANLLRTVLCVLTAGVLFLGPVACSGPGASTSSSTLVASPTSNTTPSHGSVSGPRLSFKERLHDFGQISRSNDKPYHFEFTNVGSAPLKISDVRTEPINPAS